VAIATLLQNDTSAIATKANANIKSMADLDGKTYASYGGRFEMAIVRQMIKNAGGKGDVVEVLPPKLDCFFKSVAKGLFQKRLSQNLLLY
jgi:ABC-type nitrate/sulfonate/bicarbonate transport system substrate-binding protein